MDTGTSCWGMLTPASIASTSLVEPAREPDGKGECGFQNPSASVTEQRVRDSSFLSSTCLARARSVLVCHVAVSGSPLTLGNLCSFLFPSLSLAFGSLGARAGEWRREVVKVTFHF